MKRTTSKAVASGQMSVASASGLVYDVYRFDSNRRMASRNGVIAFTITVFIVVLALVLVAAELLAGSIGLVAVLLGLILAYLVASSVSIVQEWEKAVVLRLGRFNRIAGPGLVWIIPIIEYKALWIDQRVMATYFGAEETLTSDLVPLNVDAVLFWVVYNTKKACMEVEDYASAAYANNDSAMKLRTMHLAYESVRRAGGTVVMPSAISDGFADSPADKGGEGR